MYGPSDTFSLQATRNFLLHAENERVPINVARSIKMYNQLLESTPCFRRFFEKKQIMKFYLRKWELFEIDLQKQREFLKLI